MELSRAITGAARRSQLGVRSPGGHTSNGRKALVIPVCRVANFSGASSWAGTVVASAVRALKTAGRPSVACDQQLLDRILRRILVRSIGRCAREAVISLSLLFCVFGLAGIPLAHASEPSWAGMWDTEWRGGVLKSRCKKMTAR